MDRTYEIGSILGTAADGDPEHANTAKVKDYRDVFNPRDTGRMVDKTMHSEPPEQAPNYLEIARLVRPKKSAA